MFIKENIYLFSVLSGSSLINNDLQENIEFFLATLLICLGCKKDNKRTKTLYFECLKNI